MIKTVIFDIDGTMYDYEANHRIAIDAVQDYMARILDIKTEEFRMALKEAEAIAVGRIGDNSAASHNRLIRYQCMLELLGLPPLPHALMMHHTYWDTLLEHMEAFPFLLEFLAVLKAQGVRVGIGSNMTAEIQYEKLSRLGLAPYVDWIVTSEEAGIEKPDMKFFELCLEKCGCQATECLFIGDSLNGDVKPALACGMKAVLFNAATDNAETDCRMISSYAQCLETGFLEI